MESETELEELAARVAAVAIAIRQHMAEHGTTTCGAWNVQCAETLRRAAAVLRMNGGQ